MPLNHRDAIAGALIADAASLGLHWLYEPDQITRLETSGEIMFRQPDASVFKNQKAFYAQGGRVSGQLSHYGESARLVGQLAADGHYSTSNHRAAFMNSFGPCGSFVGYADRPTKSLIANIIQSGDELRDPSGVDDDQLPAMCVVPGLFAANAKADQILLAASVISTHSHVQSGIKVVLSCLEELSKGTPMHKALDKSCDAADAELADLLKEALAIEGEDESQVAEHFGRACKVHQGMPVAWYILKQRHDLESVARANVRCGGDNCGRSMVLGTIAGFAYGIPDELIKQMDHGRVPINYL